MGKISGVIDRVQRYAHTQTAIDIFNALTHRELLDSLEAKLPTHRERLFPPTETLSMFIAQVLSSDGSCRNAVDQAATQRLINALPLCSTATGGYCQARARLPLALIIHLTLAIALKIGAQVRKDWYWHGRRVRLIDGTTLTMPDTAANQAAYPQQSNQKPGLGFPICRSVGAFNLADGALVGAAISPYQGKGSDEQRLLRELLDHFEAKDVLLGDALFATYFLFVELRERGIDAVFEQHGARRRSTDFRCGQQLGPRDHLITLTKPKQKPEWMSQAEYERAPEQITVRELACGGKVLVTTLCEPNTWPKHEIKGLYQQRWDVELNFRHLKTTLGMETLRAKTPAMAEKELWTYLLAYNLIRWLMLSSAKLADIMPRTLSFQHTRQLLSHWQTLRPAPECIHDLIEPLLWMIAQHRVGNRPGRVEPRAIKRRPKPFPLLTMTRSQARASIRRFGHPKRKAGKTYQTIAA